MKKLIIFLFLLILIDGKVTNSELTGKEIVKKADQVLHPDYAIYAADMITIKQNGEKKLFQLKIYVSGKDHALVWYLSPPRERGTGYLLDDNNMWMYFPSVERSVRISSSQTIMGTDFSTADILKVRLAEDYDAILLSMEELDGIPVYSLELKAKSNNAAYNEIKYWIKKDGFIPIKMEFYTISGKLLKILTYSEVKNIGGRTRPIKLTMESMINVGYKSIMSLTTADYETKIPDYFFTQEYLDRGLKSEEN
ncbi:MAG: outer membrane lipoprotein-sorting protein [bacterium]